jgi:hypothetical protein
MVLQVLDVGVAGQKPQKFMDDRFQMQLLGRQHRKTFGQIKPHLVAEN